jgi:SCP-2 sterol transfer family
MGKPAQSTNTRGFAVIKDLRDGKKVNASHTVARLGELLGSSGLRGTVQLRLVDHSTGKEQSLLNVTLDGSKAKTGTGSIDKPDFELITTPETWSEIASSQLPPILAFLTGRLRVRGDVRLAQVMHRHLAEGPGRTYLCGEE